MGGGLWGFWGTRKTVSNDVRVAEALRWSWARAAKGGMIGTVLGLLLFILPIVIESWGRGSGLREVTTMFIDVFRRNMHDEVLKVCGGLGAVGGFFSGLRRTLVEKSTIPNQGIRLSFRNMIMGGTISIVVATLASSVIEAVDSNVNSMGDVGELIWVVGVPVGLAGAFWYGGMDLIQHYTLRHLLARNGHLPRKLVPFLDYAAEELHFLQKVGGGYLFIHRYLLEHFAAMDAPEPQAEIGEQQDAIPS